MKKATSHQQPSWQSVYSTRESLTAFGLIAGLSLASIIAFAPTDEVRTSISQTIAIPPVASTLPFPGLNKRETTSLIHITIDYGDTFLSLANHHRIPKKVAQQILQDPLAKRYLRHLHPYHSMMLTLDKYHTLTDIDYHFDADKKLHVHRQGNNFSSYIVTNPLQPRVHFTQATVKHSLFVAGARAGLSENLMYQLTNHFAWDIDFARDIQPGDKFSVMYTDYYMGDKKIQNGNILAASFTCKGETYRIVRFTDQEGNSGYYTPDGHSVHKAFLRAPLHYTRISSPFNLHRLHPMLHRLRKHVGVDYAAPYGTPIKATASGKVAFYGRKGGYGNTVILQHGKVYTTVYAHLSRFNHKLHTYATVHQGDIIGYVGTTGLATGPHVHYEFRVNGQHVDPLKNTLPRALPIDGKNRHEFAANTQSLLSQLELYKSAALASSSKHYPIG